MDKPEPSSSKPSGTYLSPTLREKLEGGGGGGRSPRDEDQMPAWVGWLVLALLLVAIAAVGIGVMGSNAEKKRKDAAAALQARADSLRQVATAESLAALPRDTTRADSIRAARASASPAPRATPAPTSGSRPAGGTTPGATTPTPAETRRYGLIVGEYLDEERANSEKDRMAASTGLTGRVVPIDNGGSFRVILGSFEGRAAAEKAASDLSGKGLVNEARVTALPR